MKFLFNIFLVFFLACFANQVLAKKDFSKYSVTASGIKIGELYWDMENLSLYLVMRNDPIYKIKNFSSKAKFI